MIKTLLQKLLTNNSSNLYELFKSFQEQFPEETGAIELLRDYLFSAEKNEFRDETLVRMLNNLMEGKA